MEFPGFRRTPSDDPPRRFPRRIAVTPPSARARGPARIVFQQVTYGGMPVVVEALDILVKTLAERGDPDFA